MVRPFGSVSLSIALFLACPTHAQNSIFNETPPSAQPVYHDNGTFVSTSGSDINGDGSLANPFRTIQHTLDQATPGDVIILREGVYNESREVRFRQPNITLRSRAGERVVIQAPVDNEDSFSVAVLVDAEANGIKLQGLEIIGGYYYGIMMQTKWDWGDPDDRAGASQILIEDCIIHDTGRDCIKITPNCDDVTIRRCEIYRSGVGPANVAAENAEGIDNVNGDRMRVEDCFIHDIYSTGIYFKGGATGCVVERCRISNCGGGGVMVGFDTSPEFFDLTVNPDRYECIQGMVRNCLISTTGYAGIGFYAAKESYAVHNTLIDCAREAHSPLYFGVSLQDWEVDENPNDGIGYRPSCKLITIKNNLVEQNNTFPATMVSIRTFEHDQLGRINGLADMPIMGNNLYFSQAGQPRFVDDRPYHILEDGTLQQWQAHIAGDYTSFSQQPLLDGTGHLTADSPAINRGVCLDYVKYDMDGQERNNNCDIGADEWMPTTGVMRTDDQMVLDYGLGVYPNPGNARAILRFVLPQAGRARVDVFNIRGENVMVLMDEWRVAGTHHIHLDGHHWPSGQYRIVMTFAGQRKCVPWMLVR